MKSTDSRSTLAILVITSKTTSGVGVTSQLLKMNFQELREAEERLNFHNKEADKQGPWGTRYELQPLFT